MTEQLDPWEPPLCWTLVGAVPSEERCKLRRENSRVDEGEPGLSKKR